jgi:hypothetical protein
MMWSVLRHSSALESESEWSWMTFNALLAS